MTRSGALVHTCTVYALQVDFLQRRNQTYKTLKFVDISAEDYSPEDNAGVSFEAVGSKALALAIG